MSLILVVLLTLLASEFFSFVDVLSTFFLKNISHHDYSNYSFKRIHFLIVEMCPFVQ